MVREQQDTLPHWETLVTEIQLGRRTPSSSTVHPSTDTLLIDQELFMKLLIPAVELGRPLVMENLQGREYRCWFPNKLYISLNTQQRVAGRQINEGDRIRLFGITHGGMYVGVTNGATANAYLNVTSLARPGDRVGTDVTTDLDNLTSGDKFHIDSNQNENNFINGKVTQTITPVILSDEDSGGFADESL